MRAADRPVSEIECAYAHVSGRRVCAPDWRDALGWSWAFGMRREKKKKTAAGDGNWLVILGVAFVVLLLLVRMIAYVAHARRHW